MGDLVMQITRSACEEGEASTSALDKRLLELNASPSTVKYLKMIRSYLKEHSVIIQGALPTSSLFLGVHYEDQAFTCTGMVRNEYTAQRAAIEKKKKKTEEEGEDEEVEEEPPLQMSSWFKKLMIDLSQRKLALLVDMQEATTGAIVTGVLEPLTSVTASLKVIKPSMVRTVERLVMKFHTSKNSSTGESDGGKSGLVSDKMKCRIRDVAKNCVKQHARGQWSRRKSTNKAHSPNIHSGLQGRAEKAMTQFNPHQLEAWYHKGPTHGVPVKFVEHLKEIPEDLSKQQDQSHPTLEKLLYDLEVMYDKHAENAKNESAVTTTKEVTKLKVKKTLNVGTRTVSIMKQSMNKNVNKKKPAAEDKNKEPVTEEKPHVNKAYIEIVKRGKTKYTSEEEFGSHLQTSYKKCLTGELDSLMWVFKTMRPILLYAKSKCSDQVFTDLTEELVKHVREIASKALLINHAQLRQRYINMDNPESYEHRVREVEMQVLLRLEMEALLPTVIEMPEKDKNKEDEESEENVLDESMSEEIILPDHVQEMVDEMVTMLQSIPIWLDHSRLTTFLEDVVSNYHKILGPILKVVYNDLMLAKPEELMSPTRKPKSLKKQQSVEAPSSYGSMVMPSVAGQRSKSLVRHPSFDVGSKRVIPVVIKKEASKKTKEKKKKKKEQEDDQAKRVCRNLFSGGGEAPLRRSPRKKVSTFSRRQSVAVMESSAKEPPAARWTSPRRRTPGKSPSRFVLKTRIVKETPGKKQVLQAMLNKQDLARKHITDNKSDENSIVEESPDKVVKETPHPKRRTPGKSQPKLTRHHSHRSVFYSKKGPKSTSIKNMKEELAKGRVNVKEELSKGRAVALRIAGKTPEARPVGRRLLHSRTQSASSTHLFSNFASPTTLLQSRKMLAVKTEPEDSPSKNTRSQVMPDVLSSPKSSKRTPTKSPRRTANRALWKSPDKSVHESALKSPIKTPKKVKMEVMVEDTPDKTVERKPLITSPIKHSPIRTPKKSPTRTPQKGSSLRVPRKSSSEAITVTSTPITHASIQKKIPVETDIKMSITEKRQISPSENEENLGASHKEDVNAPCGRCISGDMHSSRLLSSASFLQTSEMSSRCLSTASSLEDVFDSPPRKSPARKANRTPEIVKVWKQKKPQNGASPKMGVLKSPKSSTRSDSPVFGSVSSPPLKRPTSSPYSGKRQKVIKQSPATKGKPTSSPIFGKQIASPGRKKSLRSPSSTGKQSKLSKGSGKIPGKKTKGQKKLDEASGSILSWLDIKGLKGASKAATKNDNVNTLLEITDIEHEKSQEAGRKKRGRNEIEEEEVEEDRLTKRRKSTQDDDDYEAELSDVELLDVDDLECESDEEVNFKNDAITLVNLLDVPDIPDTSQVNTEDMKEFLSPSRKLKTKQSPRIGKSSGDSPGGSETETGVQTEASTSDGPIKHKSFRRLPTRRSLATKMSSGNSPSTSDQMSPMFSDDTDDSMLLSSEEDVYTNYPDVAKAISELQTPSGETSKAQYTPVSKRGLSDLMNSPLISSSEKLKKAVKAKGKKASSRRHVSFSSE
ncbi:uncharacterized protein [Amphiura filiformis]|uniref:uncharacterized protein n=1 Tax=Amphiura filiformis TaxID=82378 RepID=UPI003B2234CE